MPMMVVATGICVRSTNSRSYGAAGPCPYLGSPNYGEAIRDASHRGRTS